MSSSMGLILLTRTLNIICSLWGMEIFLFFPPPSSSSFSRSRLSNSIKISPSPPHKYLRCEHTLEGGQVDKQKPALIRYFGSPTIPSLPLPPPPQPSLLEYNLRLRAHSLVAIIALGLQSSTAIVYNLLIMFVLNCFAEILFRSGNLFLIA